ncbi:MAG: DUF3105 domain-containing protein [Acidimicrobiales bacterium]
MPDPTTDDPGSTTGSTTGSTAGDAERSPTAAGRSGWIVIGLIGLVLAAVLALTAFWSDGSSSSAVPTADGSTSTSAATTSGSTGACAASVSEPLDPTAAIRLLPNAPEPTYDSDPPTSGAFVVGASVGATPSSPLSRPVQVGLLAQGKVLIQYGPSLPAADVADLQGLAGDDIVVAPNPTLASPIVATAWRVRQTCDQLDLSALRQFATVNANRAPDANASTTTTAG